MASLFSFHRVPKEHVEEKKDPLLVLDYREVELIQCLTRRRIPHTVAPLPVGDIWIGISVEDSSATPSSSPPSSSPSGGVVDASPRPGGLVVDASPRPGGLVVDASPRPGGLVVERKRITDFEASFLDGRYREQRGRILAFCQHQGHQPIYLLEGSWSSLTGRITKKAMIKLLNRLTLRYQLPLLHTESVEETAEWIECLMEQWKEDPTALQRTQERVKVTDGLHVQKKQNAADPTTFLVACLAQCPGLSVKMAESIVGVYPTLTHLLALSPKELEEHKVGTRRVGPAVAKRLWSLLHP